MQMIMKDVKIITISIDEMIAVKARDLAKQRYRAGINKVYKEVAFLVGYTEFNEVLEQENKMVDDMAHDIAQEMKLKLVEMLVDNDDR